MSLHFLKKEHATMRKFATRKPIRDLRSIAASSFSFLAIAALTGCAAADEDTMEDRESEVLAQTALPQSVEIESVTATGSGCPIADSYTVIFAPDRSMFTLEFKDLNANTTPNAGFDLESCSIAVKVKGQEGVAYAPVGISVKSRLGLKSGTTAKVNTDAYWVGGNGPNATATTTFSARNVEEPSTGSTFRTADQQQIWSGCSGDRELRITHHLSVHGSYRNNAITQGTASLLNVTGLTFATKRCAPMPPVPDVPRIEEVKAHGPSCPNDSSTSIEISPDRTSFAILFNEFTAAVDESISFRRANCDVIVLVKTAPGQAYTLDGFSGEGTLSLDEGVSLNFTRNYRFLGDAVSGSQNSVTKSTALVGPFQDVVRIDDQFSGEERKFSSCLGVGEGLVSENVFVEISANLINSTPRRKGSFKLNQLGAFRFSVRPCANPT